MINIDKKYETAIGELIFDKFPVEWMRFNMFNLDDIYYRIPMLVFRLKCRDGNLEKLQGIIDTYVGNEKWCVFNNPFSKKENYILSIEAIREMYIDGYGKGTLPNEKEYLGEEKYKALCEGAITDIPMLLNHICRG